MWGAKYRNKFGDINWAKFIIQIVKVNKYLRNKSFFLLHYETSRRKHTWVDVCIRHRVMLGVAGSHVSSNHWAA